MICMANDPAQSPGVAQSFTMLADALVPYWRRIYVNCQATGFSDREAMAVLAAYIMASQNTGGIRPPT